MRTSEAIAEADIPEKRPTDATVARLVYTTILCAVTVMGGKTNAQEKNTANDALMRAQETIRSAIRKMDGQSFAERIDQQKRITELLFELQTVQNPLPLQAHQMIDVCQENLSPEQTGRLLQIQRSVLDNQNRLSGRIRSPEKAGKSLHAILEEQFLMPIVTIDPGIDEKMRQCFEGDDGCTSSSALMKLCADTDSIPVITNNELHLRKRRPTQRLLATDELIVLTEGDDIRGILPVPDMAMKVEQRPEPLTLTRFIVNADEFIRNVSRPKKSPPLFDIKNGMVHMCLAIKPETKRLILREEVTIGIQNLTILSIEKTDARDTWTTTVTCVIDGDVFDSNGKRNKTLFDTSRYVFKDTHGNIMPTGMHPVVRQSNMRLIQRIETADEPTEMYIRAFADIEERTIALPQ